MVKPDSDPFPTGTRTCPSVHGATNWWALSLNPNLGLSYVVALEQCEMYCSSMRKPTPISGFRGTGHTRIPGEPDLFYLRALEATSGRLKWAFPMPSPTLMWAGIVSTEGGLVFSADDDGDWGCWMPGPAKRSGVFSWEPYALLANYFWCRRTYATVAVETHLFTFGLPDTN